MDEQSLQDLWDALLSRESGRVREMYNALSLEEQQGVRKHLQRMATEQGWHAEQRASAIAALKAIEDKSA